MSRRVIINEAARLKLVRDIRELMELNPPLCDERSIEEAQRALARFSGAASAVLSRVATILETGRPDAYPGIDGPAWIREFDARWRAPRSAELPTEDEEGYPLVDCDACRNRTLDENTDVCRNPACPSNDIVREAIAKLEADSSGEESQQ